MSPHECGLATPWLMVKVVGSENSQGFTLGYSRDRPIRGSSHPVCKAIINRYSHDVGLG